MKLALPNPLSPKPWKDRFLGLWPQVPLALAVMFGGVANIIDGLRQNFSALAKLQPLLDMESSLSVFGSGTQVFLGAFLVIVGIGLLWRLAVAWSFAFLLLLGTVAVNVFQENWRLAFFVPLTMLVATWFWRRSFLRRAPGANYLFSSIGLLAVVGYGSLGSFLLGRGFHPKIEDFIDGFYFTIVTISTVGYGDMTPVTLETRLFVVSLIVVGLSIFATITASVLGPALSGELTRLFRPEEQRMKPKNHVILAGEGPISVNAASTLADKGVAFVKINSKLMDADSSVGQVVTGNPCEEKTLLAAGVDAARLVIAAGEDDGENAFISLVAKDINPKVSVLAVASSEKAIPRLKLARADQVFAPHVLGGRLLVDLAMGEQISDDHRDLLANVKS